MLARALPRFFLPLVLVLPVACSSASSDDGETGSDKLTGINSAQRGIHFQSQVYVPVGTSDDVIKVAIARQVKTAIGALREPEVSIDDRASTHNVDPSTWTRQTLAVVDPRNPSAPASQIVRITFPYNDKAVVTNKLSGASAVSFTMLADDYSKHDAPVKADCADDVTDTDSLWYHYTPTMAACSARIQAELAAITAERSAIGSDATKVGVQEATRWFAPVTAKLDARVTPDKAYSPEYDRLYGMGTDKSQVLVYAFFGVDSDENNPDDILGQEAVRFLRTMLHDQPSLRPVNTTPAASLTDISVDGQALANVTLGQMFSWILDRTGYPTQVGTDATKILALRKQAMGKFTERRIDWDLPVTVKDAHGTSKDLTIEVRTFYGVEDGSDDARQHAQWRYREAFWYGDVFLYNGHSHFGHGPLEPTLYGPSNFNDRYQIMLVNSCISYNYYHEDFFSMKPGGTKNLDMVLNGLPAYVNDMGLATGHFLTSLIDGQMHSYPDLLRAMELNEPWDSAYDPMRVVDGELDNAFSQPATPITMTTRPWPAGTPVTFVIDNADFTRAGQQIEIVGSVDGLGQWSAKGGLVLSGASFPTWTGTVNLPPGTTFQFKAVEVESGAVVQWEQGANRSFTVPASGAATVHGSWQR